MFAYAIPSLNEPACADTQYPSNSTVTGPWSVTPSGQSNSEYLTAELSGANKSADSVSVVFKPDIKQKGNYTVTIFTPGCLQDNTCVSRGIVNVTGNYATSTLPGAPLQTQIFQTNYYDKYDEIYQGPVDVNSGDFRPTVRLTPISGQADGIKLVAQRVQFNLSSNSTGELNGLFEFNPNSNSSMSDFSNSTIDQAGEVLDSRAIVTSIAILNNITYVAGNFTDRAAGFENIFFIGNSNSTTLPNGGLNAQVSTMLTYEDLLYVGGNFTNTVNGSIPGLNNIAAYNTTSKNWQALGAGVSGAVGSIVSLEVNVTANQPETCITFNGFFDQIEAFGSAKSVPVQGFGIWVPSRQNWVQNLNLQSQALAGQLSAMTNVTGSTPLLAGTLSAQDMSANDAVALTSGPLHLNPLNVGIRPKQAGPVTRKRAVSGQNVTGVVTGLFHASSGQNVTILGGHFTATATNGSIIDNLAFLNASGVVSGLASGLDSDSVFLSLATSQSVLYAGGTITGKVNNNDVNGIIVYDLGQAAYSHPQPPAFGGNNVAVNAITMRPNNNNQVFVGGSFDTAGSLGCPSVCIFENGAWSQPSNGIAGSVAALTWQGDNKLLVGGNLTVNNNATTLANYDAQKNVWTTLAGASGVPGPVTALTPANSDASDFWVAGKSGNGSAFLMKYSGNSFTPVGDVLGNQTTIRGLSVLQLSKQHDDNPLVQAGMTLLVTGELNLPTFGNASAALFNGTTFSPFILSTSGNGPGSISQLFSEKQVNFKSLGKFHTVIAEKVLRFLTMT